MNLYFNNLFVAQTYSKPDEGTKDQPLFVGTDGEIDYVNRAGALGLSQENMILVREKKEEIEKVSK